MLARIQPGAKMSPASVMIQGFASAVLIASAAAANTRLMATSCGHG